MEVSRDELSKLMSVGTELAKEIQEIKRSWVPKSVAPTAGLEPAIPDDNKDKDKKVRKPFWGKKKSVNDVDAEESTPASTSDAP